jgi:uncharacterized LabA/DUF88 family protein
MIRKLIGIDLTPFEIISRGYEFNYFPIKDIIELVNNSDNVDVIETLTTIIEYPDTFSTPFNISNFTRKLNGLEETGATVIRCPAKYVGPDLKELKQSDDQKLIMAITEYAMKLKPDFLTLFAGDGDFAPMVSFLRSEGIRTELVTRSDISAQELRRVCYSVINIDQIFKEILIPKYPNAADKMKNLTQG